MKILLINQHFVLPDEPGFTRHYEMAKFFVDHGYEFTVVASGLNYQTGEKKVEHKRMTLRRDFEGINILYAHILPSLHRNFFWRIISFITFMLSSLWAALGKSGPVDIIMGTSPPLFQAFSAWIVSFVRRKPFMLEIRDLWVDDAIEMGVLTNPILIKLARWLEYFLYHQATHILVNSPAYRTHLIKEGIPENKVSFIAYGADIESFNPDVDGSEVRRELELENKVVVTYTGALGLANDIYTILRAAKIIEEKSSSICIVLVGNGIEKQRLVKAANELNLKNVIFAGTYPKTRMPEVLASADICLATLQNIPMFKTVYPNKVFDYMAAGKPIVLGINGVIREVIEEAGCGLFVPPGNETQLAQAIMELSNAPQHSKLLGLSGRSYAEEYFNRRLQLQRMVSLFERIASPD